MLLSIFWKCQNKRQREREWMKGSRIKNDIGANSGEQFSSLDRRRQAEKTSAKNAIEQLF